MENKNPSFLLFIIHEMLQMFMVELKIRFIQEKKVKNFQSNMANLN